MLRIIDANANRLGEGLRLLEDIARFLLDDAHLSQQFREIRHDLAQNISPLSIKLLTKRNSEQDIGVNTEAARWQDLSTLASANAKRIEESLRVMEELAKLPKLSQQLDSSKFKRARFAVYTLEQKLLSKILRRDKLNQLAGLYVILDTQALGGRDEIEVASQVIQGGAKVIQFRDKQSNKVKGLATAQKLKQLCSESNVLFIVNDHLDLALAADADGLHIGQSDLPLPAARQNLAIDKIIGYSASTLAQAQKAEVEGADYIAVGSVFPSTSKQNAAVVGLETLRQIKQAVSLLVVAIGGINESNIDQVIATGVDSIAVISAILSKEDIKKATQQLVAKIAKEDDR